MPANLLTYPEAAEYLRIDGGNGYRAVKRLVAAGRLAYVEVSPKIRRIRREDLDAYIAASVKGGARKSRARA